MRKTIFFILLLTSTLIGCKHNTDSQRQTIGGDTIQMAYARHITMIEYDKYTVVSLENPWKEGQTLQRYVLVDRKDSAWVKDLPEGTVVYTPVKSSVVFTSPHCYLLSALGAESCIKGVCDAKYINLQSIRNGVQTGHIADCGNSMNPNVERIVELRPQAMLLSPYENSNYSQLTRTGTPLILCAEYMETSALGRAEWMRFYGRLFGCGRRADSLFHVVDSTYTALKRTASRAKHRPTVITERKTGSVWYCPGGNSTMSQLLTDAGARYPFASDNHSGSLALSSETVIDKAHNADIWLFAYSGNTAPTRPDLLAEYEGYKQIKAFTEGRIFGCSNTATLYFEESTFRPDLLMRELTALFGTIPSAGYKPRYYKRI